MTLGITYQINGTQGAEFLWLGQVSIDQHSRIPIRCLERNRNGVGDRSRCRLDARCLPRRSADFLEMNGHKICAAPFDQLHEGVHPEWQ